jgi:hypothetical protein
VSLKPMTRNVEMNETTQDMKIDNTNGMANAL